MLPEDRRLAAGGDPEIFRILYLGLCFSEKGLFDAVEGVVLANRGAVEQRSPIRFELRVAGKFYLEGERRRFEERIAAPDAQIGDRPAVCYEGFVSGEIKVRLLREADCLCFPTYYSAESFGLVVVEAMAFGLGVIATRWRGVPELFPAGYAGLVDPRQPGQIAAVLEQFARENSGGPFRERFLAEFERARFIERVRDALLTLEPDQAGVDAR
jgi:glycosyltransferase involved in cell wall biosynthesis